MQKPTKLQQENANLIFGEYVKYTHSETGKLTTDYNRIQMPGQWCATYGCRNVKFTDTKVLSGTIVEKTDCEDWVSFFNSYDYFYETKLKGVKYILDNKLEFKQPVILEWIEEYKLVKGK